MRYFAKKFFINHIAVRCRSHSATLVSGYLSQCNRILNETTINGRNIALFELMTPMVLKGKAIHCIKLP
ncbi:VOC family protein [Sodalis-like endosymbiont of Proechinophthirus fluctus]|uniref:VOC family protein n=1 Tax=Sodalis-like endosymbiont of Proechinophthirus fluctus TaxID=1462730 RepID=UPI001650A365